jgi:hypothetical protein
MLSVAYAEFRVLIVMLSVVTPTAGQDFERGLENFNLFELMDIKIT